MTDDYDDVSRVANRLLQDRKRARALYAELFGRPFDCPGIDEELHQLFDDRSGETIAVPDSLVLALILRPPPGKGHGKKRPPIEPVKRRWNKLVVRSAEDDWARRVKANGRKASKQAKHDAAVAAYRRIKGHSYGVETIKAKMNLARGMRDIAPK